MNLTHCTNCQKLLPLSAPPRRGEQHFCSLVCFKEYQKVIEHDGEVPTTFPLECFEKPPSPSELNGKKLF